jgi:hypothetical protein
MGNLSFQNIKETTKGYGQKWNTIQIVDQRLPLMYIHNSLGIIKHFYHCEDERCGMVIPFLT